MAEDKIGFWGAVSIGIGGMVGGGIFAVLGLSVQLARGAAPIAFGVAGAVALLTAWSYARLSVAFPSQGGTVTFLYQAFGPGLFTGTANVLLWISYIVMLALYAHAFGSYGALLFPAAHRGLWTHALISAVIVAITRAQPVQRAARSAPPSAGSWRSRSRSWRCSWAWAWSAWTPIAWRPSEWAAVAAGGGRRHDHLRRLRGLRADRQRRRGRARPVAHPAARLLRLRRLRRSCCTWRWPRSRWATCRSRHHRRQGLCAGRGRAPVPGRVRLPGHHHRRAAVDHLGDQRHAVRRRAPELHHRPRRRAAQGSRTRSCGAARPRGCWSPPC